MLVWCLSTKKAYGYVPCQALFQLVHTWNTIALFWRLVPLPVQVQVRFVPDCLYTMTPPRCLIY